MHLLTALLSEGSIIDLDGTFFIQMAIFWIAFFSLRKLVFHPILAVFDAREEAIDGARRKAKEFEQEATSKEKEFATQLRKVRVGAGEQRDKLRAEAKHLEDVILDKVHGETSKMMQDADAQMAREAASIREDFKTQTPLLAKQIASKLLQREIG